MAENNDRILEPVFNIIRVGNLPFRITVKQICMFFERFGTIKKPYLKRRAAKDSHVYLANPYVILIFDKPESVDQIMAERPLYMGDCLLHIRRFMPRNPKYPHEPFLTVAKILIRTPSEQNDEILPDDQTIIDYLAPANGKIEYFERLDENTVLVQFDDYDPVDICCLSRPHFIKDHPVEIEKCSDEEQVRQRIELKKLNSISTNLSPKSITVNFDNPSMDTASPAPILSLDDQMAQLQSAYNGMTTRFEGEHEQLIASLSEEWKQTAKERIRLQRLTHDYNQESKRIREENRLWQKSFNDSLKEKPFVQAEGERQFKEACQKYHLLVQNTPQ